jgi:hypothetical protein
MQFHCPSCGFKGNVRIPAHLPKGKTVRIRCSRCQKPFPLSLGKLFPQEQTVSYQALTTDSLGCRGTKVGNLWIESKGPKDDRMPVLVLPSHPALAHDVMHDLMDPFTEFLRVCYLEFPGTARNPADLDHRSYSSLLGEHIPLLQKQLGAAGIHLLAHLSSAALALDTAVHQASSIASVILVEPDFSLADPSANRSAHRKLNGMIRELQQEDDREELVAALLQDLWDSKLPQPHARGLAKILAPGFKPGNLNHPLIDSPSTLHYRKLSRQGTPVLIFHARDGSNEARRDAYYLQASLRTAETEPVEKGGAWAAWFRSSGVANRLLTFKRSVQSRGAAVSKPLRNARPSTALPQRSQTLNGQPLGWMVLVFALLAVGLAFVSSYFRFQPDFMAAVIPALLAGLLPILWFVIPRKINPIVFFRCCRLSLKTVVLPLVIGGLCGAFFRSLLLTLGDIPLPDLIPSGLLSILPGNQGRLYQLAGVLVVCLFVFGVAGNLWVLRRSRLQVLMPTLLFTLLPPAFPDILWRLPLGFAAAVLFATSLSIFSPLFLLVGFSVVTQLPIPFEGIPVTWQSIQGVAITTAALAAAILLAVFLGTSGKGVAPEKAYFTRTINRNGRLYKWGTNLGIVLVVFSVIAAGALIFGLIEI